MTIFCDTNIVMEYLQQRQFAEQVEQILTHATQYGDTLVISAGSFYTITYLTERYLKADQSLSKQDRMTQLRLILNGVLGTFKLADQLTQTIKEGVNDPLLTIWKIVIRHMSLWTMGVMFFSLSMRSILLVSAVSHQ